MTQPWDENDDNSAGRPNFVPAQGTNVPGSVNDSPPNWAPPNADSWQGTKQQSWTAPAGQPWQATATAPKNPTHSIAERLLVLFLVALLGLGIGVRVGNSDWLNTPSASTTPQPSVTQPSNPAPRPNPARAPPPCPPALSRRSWTPLAR